MRVPPDEVAALTEMEVRAPVGPELAAAGRPAVLVPFPHSAGGHQEANARAAEDRGAAVCLLQAQLGSADGAEGLAAVLTSLATDPVRLGSMAAAVRKAR